MLRVDKGTENVGLASVHIMLRLDDELAVERSFMYGPSKHNIVSS